MTNCAEDGTHGLSQKAVEAILLLWMFVTIMTN
jgi:hypothetical protein